MSPAVVIYWRDIPTQIVVGAGRVAVKRALAARFMAAVDRAAMADQATSEDAYLGDWRRVPVETGEEDPEEAAEALAAKIEAEYPATRLAGLVRHGGAEPVE